MLGSIPGRIFLSIKPGLFYEIIKKEAQMITMIQKKSGCRNLKINTLSIR
tara:strand:- start:161 stop:310 length:150 start_codon:yes stop_codon:yes gene_type:complete